MIGAIASMCLSASTPIALLDADRRASGALSSGTLTQNYAYRSGGMDGSASLVFDLRNGFYLERFRAGSSRKADGFDGRTPWMADLSGFTSPQMGGNKPALAINAAYRNANAWWRADRGGATIKPMDCNSIEVIPPAGEPFRASFDPKTHLLAGIREQSDFGHVEATYYSRYQPCGGRMVPAYIEIVSDDDPATAEKLVLQKCHLSAAKRVAAFAMPKSEPDDWSLPASGRATIAMRPHDTDVMVNATINGSGPYLFYLDTGGHNILSPRLARELGLKIEGSERSGGAGEATVETAYAKVASIDVGGARLHDQTVLVLETSPPEIVGEQIGGVLGVEFFERFVVSLDYKANEVTFERPQLFTAAQREAAGIPVRFQFYDHMPQVAGTFDQLPARYNIDTGSGQFVTMTSPYVEKEKLRARYPDAVTIVDGFGTGGASRSSIVRARSLTLGQAKVERIPAGLSTAQHGSFSDPAYSGNVGNGVLRNFRVTFDYAHQTMYLKRVPNPDMSAYGYNRTGLTIVLKDGKPRIADVAAGTPAASTPIEPGDYLISVAGIDVAGKSLREVRDLLKQAPVGKPISIAYTRNGNELRTTLVPRDMLP